MVLFASYKPYRVYRSFSVCPDHIFKQRGIDRYDCSDGIVDEQHNGNPDSCLRYTFAYENAAAGQGRFIHTYKCDGNPLPSFEGEPKLVEIPNDIDEFADLLWKSLNQDNKVSLFVRFIDIETGNYESRIVNKNK